MDAIARKFPQTDGSMVRVEIAVHDSFMGITETGFSEAKIINSSISIRFLGSQPYIFKPGLPFSTSVSVCNEFDKLQRNLAFIKTKIHKIHKYIKTKILILENYWYMIIEFLKVFIKINCIFLVLHNSNMSMLLCLCHSRSYMYL